MAERPYSVPVILGTPRRGRRSEAVASLILEELGKRPGVETELIDVRDLDLPTDDAGEDLKDRRFSEQMNRADGLVLVVPEYNHGYPGLLKHALDTNLKEYIHKAVGVAGVTTGPFGGTRVVENLLPVLRRTDKFLAELLWMAKVLRHGREHVSSEDVPAGPTVDCPRCGAFMNPQGRKLVMPRTPEEEAEADAALGGILQRLYACPNCGFVDARGPS